MAVFKAGDLVVLRSGGPTMTVDSVNTDIFDDNKITGVLCVWFVGERFERVRFDHKAIELAVVCDEVQPPRRAARDTEGEVTGDYSAVLDSMVGAMNTPANEPQAIAKPLKSSSKRPRSAMRTVVPEKTH